MGKFLREVMKLNMERRNRIFGPDETASNRLVICLRRLIAPG